MKREEAIEVIKELQPNDRLREALRTIIPELAESEDERIRKALIESFKTHDLKALIIANFTADEVIAWLEKQKEQKSGICAKTEVEYADKYSHDVWEKLMSKFKDIEGYSIGCNDVSDIVLNAILNAFKWKKDQENKPQPAELSEDERIRKWLYDYISNCPNNNFAFYGGVGKDAVLNYLEKQKDASKDIEAVDRIDKYIDAHTANAHDMDDSNPDKKYYQGLDDALGKIAGILQDVYSDEKQKEQKPAECLKPEKDCWYVCIKDFYGGGKKQSSNGDLVQAKGGMYMMCREDISEWFRKAYYDEIRPAEWDEEDKRAIDRACVALRAYSNGELPEFLPSELLGYADRLQSLRPQPKQEWSEENKKIDNGEFDSGSGN